jgi:hypothetical protein
VSGLEGFAINGAVLSALGGAIGGARPSGRRILGNLLAEDELAPLVLPEAHHGPPNRATLAAVSGFATLLRVFAGEGDRLWTPAPVAPGRLAAVPGLPLPVLESGPLAELPPLASPADLLAWCEAPGAAALRGPSAPLSDPPLQPGPLHEVLWRLPTPPPVVVAAVHDRAFCLALGQQLGHALPGARLVASLGELEEAAAEAPAWVVKARFSAAGRDRHIERPPLQGAGPAAALSAATRRKVADLLARHGPLLFEPWLARVSDAGCSAVIAGGHLGLLSVHRQLIDRDGRFRGIEVPLSQPDLERLGDDDRRLLEQVASALHKAGYCGPFGIDSWRYRRPDGSLADHRLGEINARMTFGLVARALADRVAEPLGWTGEAAGGGHVRLLLGRTPTSSAAVPLLYPEDGAPGAWVELVGGSALD